VPTRPAAGRVVLIAIAVLLHAFGLPVDRLSDARGQRGVLIDVGVNLGSLFAALLGALAITSEFRTGTIRPTPLATPRRTTVIGAKTICVLVAGAITGLLAAGTAAAVGGIGLAARAVTIQLTAGDITRLLLGATLAGALWAVIGLGVSAPLSALKSPPSSACSPGSCSSRTSLATCPAGSASPPARSHKPSAALAAVLLIAYATLLALAGLTAHGAARRRLTSAPTPGEVTCPLAKPASKPPGPSATSPNSATTSVTWAAAAPSVPATGIKEVYTRSRPCDRPRRTGMASSSSTGAPASSRRSMTSSSSAPKLPTRRTSHALKRW
jgi:hypothetical protein